MGSTAICPFDWPRSPSDTKSDVPSSLPFSLRMLGMQVRGTAPRAGPTSSPSPNPGREAGQPATPKGMGQTPHPLFPPFFTSGNVSAYEKRPADRPGVVFL